MGNRGEAPPVLRLSSKYEWQMLGAGRSAVTEGFLLSHLIEGWIDCRAERDVAKKTAPVDSPVRVPRSQSPYSLKARTYHPVGMRLAESLFFFLNVCIIVPVPQIEYCIQIP